MIGGLAVYPNGYLRTEKEAAIFGTLNGCPFAQNEAFPDTRHEEAQGPEERLQPQAEAPGPRRPLTRLK